MTYNVLMGTLNLTHSLTHPIDSDGSGGSDVILVIIVVVAMLVVVVA